jgi:hypothetical protein
LSKGDGGGEENGYNEEPNKSKPHGTDSRQDAAERKKPQKHEQKRTNQVAKFMENAWRSFRSNANSILVIITATLVVVTTISNWVLIHDQRAYSVTDLRPYVIYDGHEIQVAGPNKLNFYMSFHNAGKTPAVNVVSRFDISTFASSDARTLDQRIDHAWTAMTGLKEGVFRWAIGQGVSKRPKLPETFAPGEIDADMRNLGGWVFVAQITYTDSFRGDYISEYCVFGTGGKIENYAQCPRHNDLQ